MPAGKRMSQYGLDAANANDFKHAKDISAEAGGGPIKDAVTAATVFYKMNQWVQFGFEEGNYNGKPFRITKMFALRKSLAYELHSVDWRTEFGPVFTF